MTAVILDTDIGTDIGDTWALAMLLGCPELNLKLVTTVTGDTSYRAKIAAGILAAAGRDDIPVGIGIATALPEDVPPYPQAKFAASVDLDEYRGGVRKDGAAALVECVMTSEESVTVIGIGPMTNIGAALALEPAIAERARLVAMLGSVRKGYLAWGDGQPAPEYNVALDVAACRAAFAADWEKTITPLDTCGEVVLRGERYRAVRESTSPLIQAVLENYKEFYETWRAAGGFFHDFFDRLDDHFGDVDADAPPYWERSGQIAFDEVAIYLAYDESLLNIERLRITVDDDGLTRESPNGAELRVATSWRDRSQFEDHLAERLTAPETASTTKA